MVLQTTNGYPEIVLLTKCDVELFYKTADWLEEKKNFAFLKKTMDSDNISWEFLFGGALMELRYNSLAGLAICPASFGLATSEDRIALKKLADALGDY